MEEKKIIILKHAIPVPKEGGGEVMVNELGMERMKVKHLSLLPKAVLTGAKDLTPVDAIPIIAGLAGVPESSIEEVDMEDLVPLMEVFGGFLSETLSPEISKN